MRLRLGYAAILLTSTDCAFGFESFGFAQDRQFTRFLSSESPAKASNPGLAQNRTLRVCPCAVWLHDLSDSAFDDDVPGVGAQVMIG